ICRIDLNFYYDFCFQAEDGIRDRNVTGVQTCALPILLLEAQRRGYELHYMEMADLYLINGEARARTRTLSVEQNYDKWYEFTGEIGRASCRERVSVRSIARDLRAVVRRRLMRSMLDPS